jgi:hypothetical protein
MALNDASSNVTPNEGDSGITTTKGQSSSVVFVLEEGIDFNAIKSNNTASGEGHSNASRHGRRSKTLTT